jgi:hypothetical protein
MCAATIIPNRTRVSVFFFFFFSFGPFVSSVLSSFWSLALFCFRFCSVFLFLPLLFYLLVSTLLNLFIYLFYTRPHFTLRYTFLSSVFFMTSDDDDLFFFSALLYSVQSITALLFFLSELCLFSLLQSCTAFAKRKRRFRLLLTASSSSCYATAFIQQQIYESEFYYNFILTRS